MIILRQNVSTNRESGYDFKLGLNDNQIDIAHGTALVFLVNDPPPAYAGLDKAVTVGFLATRNMNRSTGIDGARLRTGMTKIGAHHERR